MPTGTSYHLYIPPHRIWVDDFATPANQGSQYSTAPLTLLHLLTHTHSDRINGLTAESLYKVYCFEDAKKKKEKLLDT